LLGQETWHADLKKVVSQIDASFKEFFQDIGCVGEIVLDDEDSVRPSESSPFFG
jgi:hypothetical protein